MQSNASASCLERGVEVACWISAFLTVVISLADVASDIVVAVQFYTAGHVVWFGFVIAFVGCAHVTYMIIGAEFMTDAVAWSPWAEVPRPLRWIIMLFAAQFVPLINLIAHSVNPSAANGTDSDDDNYDVDDSDFNGLGAFGSTRDGTSALPRALQEELDQSRSSRLVERHMRKSLALHRKWFGLFYVESAVEAAPQAIVQLLAILILDEASPVQQVSLCLSLFSITSKFVVLARAYDARVMVFKFALAAHDVFSIVYLFSTIVAVKDTDFYGLRVSSLGYIWIWKVIGTAAALAIEGAAMIVHGLVAGDVAKLQLLGVTLAAICLAAPAMLAYEAVKLIYGLIALVGSEPRPQFLRLPAVVTLFHFLGDDDEQCSRLRHVVTQLLNEAEYRQLVNEEFVLPASEHHDDIVAAIDDGLCEAIAMRAPDHTKAGKHRDLRSAALNLSEPFDWWKARSLYAAAFGAPDHHRAPRDYAPIVWATAFWVVTAVSQTLSLSYPFVNAGLQHADHNILQATCFYATLVALFVALCCGPAAYRYWRFNFTLVSLLYRACITLERAAAIILAYHCPRPVRALQATVALDVLPAEVAALVATFLTTQDLDTSAMTIAECNTVRRHTARDDSLPLRNVMILGLPVEAGATGAAWAHDPLLDYVDRPWVRKDRWEVRGLV